MHTLKPLAHLAEQAGELQGRGTRFHGNLYLHKNTAYKSVGQGAHDLQPFIPKDESTVPR